MSVEDPNNSEWFYERDGQRNGPHSASDLAKLIKSSQIATGTVVWRKGFQEWRPVEETELRVHLDTSAPPPLPASKVNNTIVWCLAFAPLIGYLLESFVAGLLHGDNPFAAAVAMANGKYWFVTVALNIGLAYLDEKKLAEAGHDTEKFKGWVWLVPVYLYQRAQSTGQNMAYFITWIVCFVLVLAS